MTSPPSEPRTAHTATTPQIVSEFYEFMMWFMDRTQRFPPQTPLAGTEQPAHTKTALSGPPL
jgi:hypothetical protein